MGPCPERDGATVRAMRAVALLAWLLPCWFSLSGSVRAQEPTGDSAGQPAAAPSRTPPVLTTPLQVQADAPLPEGQALTVVVVVGTDGLAQLEGCEQGELWCDAVRRALITARFEPATVDAEPVPARVSLQLKTVAVQQPPVAKPSAVAAPAAADEPVAGGEPDTQATPPAAPGSGFGAVADAGRIMPTGRALELEQMRMLPGAFGDPFRVIDSLPGVVPVLTGLPYVYVRGAPPSATAYYFDDIQVPALFHLGLGPAVVHAAMLGPIDFYPGVAPARYGRKTGGVLAGKAAQQPIKPGIHGEAELRLVDAQLLLQTPLPGGGRLEVGGRYGFPALLLMAIEEEAILQYWDYQLRFNQPLPGGREVSLTWFGSFDLAGTRVDGESTTDLALQFHRAEARLSQRVGRGEFGLAVLYGMDESTFEDEVSVVAHRVRPRLWWSQPVGRGRLRLGADFTGILGVIRTGADEQSPAADGDYYEDDDDSFFVEELPNARSIGGLFTELQYVLSPRVRMDVGLRADLWINRGHVDAAVEPRAVLTWNARDDLALHVAAGLAHQPMALPIPLPAYADVAVADKLQRAVQAELGGLWDTGKGFEVDLKGFAHLYQSMLLLEGIVENEDISCPGLPVEEQEGASGAPPVDPVPGGFADDCEVEKSGGFEPSSAYAVGMEFMLRRPFSHRVSGWLSYTLAKAEARQGDRSFETHFDVRHVANLVLQWRISEGWNFSVRGYVQSGRYPFASGIEADPRKRRRLPMYGRGDLQLSRTWKRGWGQLRFTLDWLNFTFQREPFEWSCPDELGDGEDLAGVLSGDACTPEYVAIPVTLPLLGVRGTF